MYIRGTAPEILNKPAPSTLYSASPKVQPIGGLVGPGQEAQEPSDLGHGPMIWQPLVDLIVAVSIPMDTALGTYH